MEVIITSEPEKLPPDIRALLDEDRPLPEQVRFFEEKFTVSAQFKSWWLGGFSAAIIGVVWNFTMSSFFTWRRGAAK